MPYTDRKLVVLSLKWYDLRIHRGVLDYAASHNWDVVASPHEAVALEVPEADGQIVMIGAKDTRRTRLIKAFAKPVVDLGNYSSLSLPRVLPDSAEVGRLAAEEFLASKFTHFAVFSTQPRRRPYWYVSERKEGFASAIEEAGYEAEILHFPQADTHWDVNAHRDDGPDSLGAWLSGVKKPIAIYAIEDEGAAVLMRLCHQLGIAVPEEVALIGTNNDPVICPYTEVPLSSIDLNWEGVGYQAAEQLDQLMQGKNGQNALTLVPPKGMVARKSSDTVAVEDLRVAKVLSYIKENCNSHVTVREIAESLEIPMRTLQWAFQKSMNCSVQDEISKQRIERIKEMLESTDRKVGQIAGDLGFSSEQYMNYFFTKVTGTTPNEFRSTSQAG